MKTEQQIRNLIEKNTLKLKEAIELEDRKSAKRYSKQSKYLKSVLQYVLSANLTDELLKSEIARLTDRLMIISDRYHKWHLDGGNIASIPLAKRKNIRSYYDRLFEVGKLQQSIKTYTFILK